MSATKPEFYFEHGRRACAVHVDWPLIDRCSFWAGLRKVRPYHYTYRTFVKGRWLGYSVLDVFKREFRGLTSEYYENAIRTGIITLNEQQVTCDTIIKNSDVLAHRMHRHEPPVTAEPITFIEQTDDLWVVNKPASIPVHPTGRYNHNTVLGILEASYPANNRLDRLTSGLMLISLTKERAKQMERAFRDRKVQKEYVCRVLGEFPEGHIVCDAPILTVSHKLGLNAVRPVEEGGRPCETAFERMSYNGRTSVVRCYPRTGRTHQIRVHLQHLGHPIANDPLYANPIVREALAARAAITDTGDEMAEGHAQTDQAKVAQLLQQANERDEAADAQAQARCEVCATSILPDPSPDQMCIWLHAAVYAGEGPGQEQWRYETPLPDWATAEFEGDEKVVAELLAATQTNTST
ncbi:pseudouridine synthase [Syncephalis pseudoplumigaleata]|uniref:Pseudouridine synthase n=1 Tax=Syncephalis pseudoplumigaleata TaxID=1712513 RepID=A0A4P9YTI2_9FUNG|nr:pseudouridine synthase [Syncephalis pseudoplumigaleata]|eukprot:RKP23227.1 pseudouridine synthase [Syncephalis pseudoplumigaleata]